MKHSLLLTAVLAMCCLSGLMPAQTSQTLPAGFSSPDKLNDIAGQKGLAPNSAGAFHFVVMSDRNGGQELGKWTQAVKEVNLLRPDFVMCVGDLASGYETNPNKLAAQWEQFHGENKAWLAPFFYTPGNHDVAGVEERKAYAARHNVDGHPYYSFDFRGCHFVVIDTTCMVENKNEADLVAAQWEWLAKNLAAARGSEHVFVFMHYPLWRRDAEWKKLRAMVDPAKTTMFAGHTHELKYSEVDGIACHTLAVTAVKINKPCPAATYQMFAYVTVDAGKPTVAYIPVGQIAAPATSMLAPTQPASHPTP